jgi:hypothetical protein
MQYQDRPSQYIKEIHDMIYGNLTKDELYDWIKLLETDPSYYVLPMFQNAIDIYILKCDHLV